MVWAFRYKSVFWGSHQQRGNFSMTITDQLGRKHIKPSLDDMVLDIEGPDLKIAIDTDVDIEENIAVIVPDSDSEDEVEVEAALECLSHSWDNGNFDMKICYDKLEQELVFETEIPDNSWLSIAFGPTMRNTDMLVW